MRKSANMFHDALVPFAERRIIFMTDQYSTPLTKINLLKNPDIIHNVLYETLPPDYLFNTHVHEDCEFYLLKEGQCVMTIAGQSFPVSEGEYVLIMPFIPHSISVPFDKTCTFFHIHFNLSFLQDKRNNLTAFLNWDLHHYFISSIPFYMHDKSNLQLEHCADNILSEYENITFGSITLVNLYLFEFTLLISKDIQKTFTTPLDSVSFYVNKVLQYIADNYSNKILLQDIASYLNISVRYLTKIFQEKMHISVLTYLNTYRIHQAILLMKEGMKFTDIAMQVGFSSPPHFTKIFTQLMAATPKQYRSYLIKMSSEGRNPVI